jgi:hypothetical protein
MRRIQLLCASSALSLVLIAGCSDGRGTATPGNTSNTAIHVSTSRTKQYNSIQQLISDSQVVVRVTPTSTRTVETVGATQFTVTTVNVDQVLRGTMSSRTIKVRQLGAPTGNVVIEDAPPLLQPGSSYVLFLERFTYGPGKETDQYIAVGGGAGTFLNQNGTLKRLDPASPNLLATISLTDLQRSIAG